MKQPFRKVLIINQHTLIVSDSLGHNASDSPNLTMRFFTPTNEYRTLVGG